MNDHMWIGHGPGGSFHVLDGVEILPPSVRPMGDGIWVDRQEAIVWRRYTWETARPILEAAGWTIRDAGTKHCNTCTCGCTCGYGGQHEPENAACALNQESAK